MNFTASFVALSLIVIGSLEVDTASSFVLSPIVLNIGTSKRSHHRSNNSNHAVQFISRKSTVNTGAGTGTEELTPTPTSPDYLITDSLSLCDQDRPTVLNFLFSEYPREGFLRLPLLVCGTVLSVCNVLGVYEETVYAPLDLACVILGLINAVLDVNETKGVSENIRRGSIDAKVLQVYAGTYSVSVCWLALRVYPSICPSWLPTLDPIMGTAASVLFAASLVVPLLSLWSDAVPDNTILLGTQLCLVRFLRNDSTIESLPRFTSLERYRAMGLLVIGFVACLYLPVSSYLAVYGDSWWSTSLLKYPQQGLLETSTALFGLLAAQSNISLTRAAGYGVKPVSEMATIGTLACLILAVVPCVSALFFLQNGTTFFDHYHYQPL